MTLIVMLLVLPMLIVTAFFALELLVGLQRSDPDVGTVPPSRLLSTIIVVPAHNEGAILERSLSALRNSAGDIPILLVADNCTDDTALIARNCGAEVLERFNSVDRGKGFALAHAAAAIAKRPIDVVIVIDADCYIDKGGLQALVGSVARHQNPAQALYLMTSSEGSTPVIRISNFAFLVKNLVRQRALDRLARHVHLVGTGMAFPKALFSADALATASIVEDMKLGLDLAEQSRPVRFVEGALVTSPSSDAEGTLEQRKRWEGGYFTLASAIALPLLWRGICTFSIRRIASALDLSIPPLVVFVAISVATLMVEVVLAALSVIVWALPAVHLAIFGSAIVGLALAWWSVGRRVLSLSDLARIPAYMLWKIPMYLGLAKQGAPQEWTRTTRLEETKPD